VLPFENLSRDPDNAYFAEGIKNEILTRLATVRDLKVISRTSTAKYQSKPDNLKTVAQELGVSTILEGAVQKAGDKVRVNVQLIDARADTHLWAKSYDRDLKDVLGVESDVSQEIAEALQANLSPSESHVLASARTHDTEAYDLFLRGEYEFHQAQSSLAADALDRADAFYRQALARDPNFAMAAAELAYARLFRHWFVAPLAPRELGEVKSIIDRALVVAPDSPEAHFALGLFFYWGHRQYEMALTEFNRTLELQPNNALVRREAAEISARKKSIIGILSNVAELGASRMEETIGAAGLRDAAIGTGIAVDKMLALTGQRPSVQIANLVMPSAEERAALSAVDRRLDEISRKLNAPPEGTE
jgi:TolB-like protein